MNAADIARVLDAYEETARRNRPDWAAYCTEAGEALIDIVAEVHDTARDLCIAIEADDYDEIYDATEAWLHRVTPRPLSEIQADLDAARAEVERLAAEKQAALEGLHGVHVGAIVWSTRPRSPGPVLVTHVSPRDWGGEGAKPWLKGRHRNKDGQWGKDARQLMDDWRHLTADERKALDS